MAESRPLVAGFFCFICCNYINFLPERLAYWYFQKSSNW